MLKTIILVIWEIIAELVMIACENKNIIARAFLAAFVVVARWILRLPSVRKVVRRCVDAIKKLFGKK